MIEVMIKLNPAFDGIEIEGDEPKDIEGSCLVISTNGDYKTVDVDGAIEIMDALGDDTRVDFIYNTSYRFSRHKHFLELVSRKCFFYFFSREAYKFKGGNDKHNPGGESP